MITLLLLAPMALVVVTQAIAIVGMSGQAREHDLGFSRYAASWILYVLGFAAAAACVVLGVVDRGSVVPLAAHVAAVVATVATVIGGPLAWGRAINEFHASHHLVRAAIMVVVAVLYLWHVALYR